MEKKVYTALGLMSGTSMDGVDVSIIKSDGEYQFTTILDRYFGYNDDIYQKLIILRNKILSSNDLITESNILNSVEREITIFHANVVNEIQSDLEINVDFIGFHGQTIFHDSKKKNF